jgi:hypothetical protein
VILPFYAKIVFPLQFKPKDRQKMEVISIQAANHPQNIPENI